jgi:signal transduction histidine kinase/ActR/RegA family two-component response regulator
MERAQRVSLRHYESLDRLARVITQARDVEELIRTTLGTVLEIFACDRTWLLHPCDPAGPSWRVVFEATRPEYPGALAANVELPTDATAAAMFKEALRSREPVEYGVTRPHPWAGAARFDVRSELHVALCPSLGPAWLLGMHQCTDARVWDLDETILFREIALRLTDALTNMLQTRALRESEANFRAIAENAHVGILIATRCGEAPGYAYANRDICELCGFTGEELATLDADRLLETQKPSGTWETVLVRRDGERIPVEATQATTMWHGREADLVLVRDVRERERLERDRCELLERERRARAEAERANRAKDDFLAVISHELRTPLTTVLAWTQLLRGGKLDAGKAQRAAETIERAARAQAQIVDDLLDLARIIAGNLVLDLQPVHPAPIVLAVVESLRPSAEKKGVRLIIDPQPLAGSRLVRVMSAPTRLQQVVWNLVGNAIKFTPAGGRVEVRMSVVAGECRLSVTDDGIGISPDFLPRIFDRFSQADGSKTRAHGGLGLGLTIVRAIVETHGGRVEAASEGEARGSTFTVSLPALQATELGAGPVIAPGPERIDGVRVLLVDDDEESREAIALLLRTSGAEATAVSSAEEAIGVLPALHADIIVSDIAMPGEDGYALVRRIRALRPEQGGRTPAIALTALATTEDAERAIAAGFQRHIAKPVDADALVDAVAALHRARRA